MGHGLDLELPLRLLVLFERVHPRGLARLLMVKRFRKETRYPHHRSDGTTPGRAFRRNDRLFQKEAERANRLLKEGIAWKTPTTESRPWT